MTGQARTHNLTTLDAAPVRGSVPTTDLDGDPIAVSNAGTILSETEVSAPLWNVDPADCVRTACTIAGRVCTPITAIPVNCPETIAGLLSR
jgi:hypothetical protein